MPKELNAQNIHIKPNTKLSETDKAYMTVNYPPGDNTKEESWTAVRRALDVVGADDVTKNRLVETYKLNGWSMLRQEFESWTVVEREKDLL
jgi:hypothetical protein